MDYPSNADEYLQRMQDRQERVKTQLQSLYSVYKKQESLLKGKATELKQLKSLLKKAIGRIRFAEDIPGKRVPFFLCFDVEIPGPGNPGQLLTAARPTNPSFSLRNQKFHRVQPITMDGPFVATAYTAAFRLKTFSLGPDAFTSQRTTDPAAGTEIITPLTGRFRPICSTSDPFNGAWVGLAPGTEASNVADTVPPSTGGAAFRNTFKPGTIDFLWEVADEGSSRVHQNHYLTPSRYLYSEFDRPMYLPTSDFYERGSIVKFSATLTRDLGFAELSFTNYITTDGTWRDAGSNLPNADNFVLFPVSDTMARMWVGLGGTLTFTMMGYKILQSQSPAM